MVKALVSRGIRKLLLKLKKLLRFSNMPLQRKFLLNHILVIVIPVFLIYSFIYSTYITDKKKDILELVHTSSRQAVESMLSYINDLEELSKQPLYDQVKIISDPGNSVPGIIVILRESIEKRNMTESDIKKDGVSKEVSGSLFFENSLKIGQQQGVEIFRLLNRIINFKKDISSVFIFNTLGQNEFRIRRGPLEKPYNPVNEEWFQKSLELGGRALVFVNETNNRNPEDGDENAHITVASAIRDINSTEILGVVSINVAVDYMRGVCRRVQAVEGERFLIIDRENKVIYDNDESNISKPLTELGFDQSQLQQSGAKNNHTMILNNKKYLIDIVESDDLGWKMARLLPEEALFSEIGRIQSRFMLLTLVFVILSLVLSIGMTYGITRPLDKLISTMKVVEKGDLSIRFRVKYKDEIGMLGRSFNKMLKKIENLINMVYITQLRKKEAELNALQSQINPHFIYNTLESIRMMAEINDDEPTSKMTLILGKLLRYSISTKKQKVTVRNEMEHLENYMILQNLRFGGKFKLETDINEELMDVQLIKLVFQPIVENAIYHGMETLDGQGVVRVAGRADEDGVLFTIEDNGIGMTEEQVEELNRKANDQSLALANSRGIGIRNVNERIKLYYGEEYGLSICGSPGKGTTVKLVFPCISKMNNIEV